MMEELDSSWREPSITFPPMKAGTTHVNEEREKVSPSIYPRMESQATRKNPRMKI